MKKIFNALATLITGDKPVVKKRKHLTERDLIRMESAIGAKIFGPVAKGHRREFFCLDETAWIWYEQWVDPKTKKHHSVTTRYELRPNGVLKVQDGQPYQHVRGDELKNLARAIRLYREQVVPMVYGRDHVTGQPLR